MTLAPTAMKTDRLAPLTAYCVVGIGMLIMLAPFYFMFVFATHTDAAILSVPPPMWFGTALGDNLAMLLNRLPDFWLNISWSVYVAMAVTLLNLFFCSLAGYAFALMDFAGKEKLFSAIMVTMLLPAFLGMVPTVLMMGWLGWTNEHRALIVPAACGALGIFMMRQYTASAIPSELVDAARLDNCSEWSIYWRVVLPLVSPALGTLALITFIGSWNNFVGPLVIMRDMDRYTLVLHCTGREAFDKAPLLRLFPCWSCLHSHRGALSKASRPVQ